MERLLAGNRRQWRRVGRESQGALEVVFRVPVARRESERIAVAAAGARRPKVF